jgi:membrane associated rhomboid family serine protease
MKQQRGPYQRRSGEPMFNIPAFLLGLMVLLSAIHGARHFISPEADFEYVLQLGFIPALWSDASDPDKSEETIRLFAEGGVSEERMTRANYAAFVLKYVSPQPWTFVSYGFLHGSIEHLLLNLAWLLVFGSVIMRRCGLLRFSLLYMSALISGAVVHMLSEPNSLIPLIGASAGISGLMAASLWFLFPLHDSLHNTPLRFGADMHRAPRQSLQQILANKSALIFILIWIVTNYAFGAGSHFFGLTDQSIAWQAHMGGFLAGFVLFPLVDVASKEQDFRIP